jgi:hypothetical protein
MNWITHLDTMATILVSADVASVCISAMFFSERVRRWTHRKRWGAHPAASSLLYSVALASMDDSPIGSIRPQSIAVRNPFEARTREELASGPAPRAPRDEFRRPSFKRSTVLQQRIAAYERALAAFAMARPADFARAGLEQQNEARIATLPSMDEPLNPYFERFAIGHLQEAQPF